MVKGVKEIGKPFIRKVEKTIPMAHKAINKLPKIKSLKSRFKKEYIMVTSEIRLR